MQLSSETFKDYLSTGEYTLIDVRTKEEQETYGVISQDQTHIDVSQPDAVTQIQKLPKEGKYLIYCWHGVRSAQIIGYMESLGFTNIFDLEGGIDKWTN